MFWPTYHCLFSAPETLVLIQHSHSLFQITLQYTKQYMLNGLLYCDNVLYIVGWSELKKREFLCFSTYVIYSCIGIPFISNALLYVSFSVFQCVICSNIY